MYDVTHVPYACVACHIYMPVCKMCFPCPYVYCYISRTYDALPVPYACHVDLSRIHDVLPVPHAYVDMFYVCNVLCYLSQMCDHVLPVPYV